MSDELGMKASRYDVVRAISEESYKRAMASLAHGDIKQAKEHMDVFEAYDRRASELKRALYIELEEIKNESL